MNATTQTGNPAFLRSFEKAPTVPSSAWNYVGIAALLIALAAMIAQPSFPQSADDAGVETSQILLP